MQQDISTQQTRASYVQDMSPGGIWGLQNHISSNGEEEKG